MAIYSARTVDDESLGSNVLMGAKYIRHLPFNSDGIETTGLSHEKWGIRGSDLLVATIAL
jgi:hypothetical protein